MWLGDSVVADWAVGMKTGFGGDDDDDRLMGKLFWMSPAIALKTGAKADPRLANGFFGV